MQEKCLFARFPLHAFLLAALILGGSPACAQEAKGGLEAWKLSTAVGPAFALGKAGARWAQIVTERSDGKVAVQFFPGATLAALGHRAIATTDRVLRSPADVAGLKVRAPSTPLLADLFADLGAEPRTMAFADAQASFRAGTLDAQEGSLAAFAAARLDTLGIRQVMLWGAVAEIAVFAANRVAWERWTDEQRAIVRAGALQAAAELPVLAQAEHDAALVELRKRGVTVTRLTATGRAAFAAATRGAYDKWAAAAGTDLSRATEAAIKENTQ